MNDSLVRVLDLSLAAPEGDAGIVVGFYLGDETSGYSTAFTDLAVRRVE